MSAERYYPTKCPGCDRLIADVAVGHCKERKIDCGWLRCKIASCGTVFDIHGNHYPRKSVAS